MAKQESISVQLKKLRLQLFERRDRQKVIYEQQQKIIKEHVDLDRDITAIERQIQELALYHRDGWDE